MVAGGPQVLHGVGPPGPPVGRPPGQRGRAWRAGRARGPRRTPRSPGMNASGSPRPRMAMVSIVHGPSPGSAASTSRARGPVAARRRSIAAARRSARRPSGAAASPGRRLRHGAACGRVRLPASAGRRRGTGGWVRPPAGSVDRLAVARRPAAPAWVRAAAVDTCWPMTARSANSAASTVRGTRRPGRLGHQRREHRVRGEQVADRHRVGVQVEQPAAAADRDGQVAQVGQRQLAARCSRARAAAPRSPCPCGRRRVRR